VSTFGGEKVAFECLSTALDVADKLTSAAVVLGGNIVSKCLYFLIS